MPPIGCAQRLCHARFNDRNDRRKLHVRGFTVRLNGGRDRGLSAHAVGVPTRHSTTRLYFEFDHY